MSKGLDRRSFVTGAGALAVAGAVVGMPATANACRKHEAFYLHAEGWIVFDPTQPAVVAARPGGMPPFLVGLLIGRVLDIYTITDLHDGMLRAEVWIRKGINYNDGALANLPLPVPFPANGIPISIFVVDVAEVHVRRDLTVIVPDPQGVPVEKKTNQFIALGTVVDNPVPSPFGDLKNRMFALSGEFDNEGKDVSMVFVGGFAVGSHSTWNFTVEHATVGGKGFDEEHKKHG